MNCKGLLLDFNGTLFFDSHYHELAWKAISKELRGSELSDEELREHMHGKNNEKVINYIMGKVIDPAINREYSLKKEAMYRQMCLAHPDSFVLAKGVTTFLDHLVEEHIPFTIASASIKENIDFFVEHFHLDQWLDPALIVYDDGSYPTKVGMFHEGARRIGVTIEECAVFEDSMSGIRFAHEAGAGSVVVIDSSKQPSQYDIFPYVTTILPDFTNVPWNRF